MIAFKTHTKRQYHKNGEVIHNFSPPFPTLYNIQFYLEISREQSVDSILSNLLPFTYGGSHFILSKVFL